MSEYETRFHKLSRYATAILSTKEEKIRFFIRALRTQLWIENQSLVIAS